MRIKIVRIAEGSMRLPQSAYPNDIGLDLFVSESKTVYLKETLSIPTGIKIEIPNGYAGFVLPRSSISQKGLQISTGTIDPGYRGEIKVILTNISRKPIKIEKENRIAQLVIQKVEKIELEEVKELSKSERGEKGFGSSG